MSVMKFLNQLILTVLILSFIFTLLSCSRTSTLNIEAKIIYNMGGAQAVARQKFYLLNKDLFDPDKENFKKKYENITDENAKVVFIMQSTLLYSLQKFVTDGKVEEGKEKVFLDILEKSKPVWADFIVAETITDFDGKAAFENVPSGKYWLASQTETRSAFTLWDLPLELKPGENKLLLDQNNAIYSK